MRVLEMGCIVNTRAIIDDVTIGAGATVIENILDNSVALGVPAKVIKKKGE